MLNANSHAKELEKAGFTQQQAEIIMQCQVDMMNAHFASKADISNLKAEFKSDFHGLRTELKQDIASLDAKIENTKNEMIIKFGGIVVTCTILLGIVLKLS